MTYNFYTLDVFTDKLFSGNQLAVIPSAEGLDDQTMQKIAAEFNFSETVFVFPPTNPKTHQRLRIFTPTEEIPFAGHPTIGTAFLLTEIAAIPLQGKETKIIFEEGVGNIEVKVKAKNNKPVYAELKTTVKPEFNHNIPKIADLAQILGLNLEEIKFKDYQPLAVSCGLPFLFIPVTNIDTLARARVNLQSWETILSHSWAPHLYLFCGIGENKWRVRMFAPGLGITEDPATGSGAAAFAAYLTTYESNPNGNDEWIIEQGVEMGRSSQLYAYCDQKNGNITEIRVGGACVLVSEGKINLSS
jgi:trans-2,3-dihydro-3-hydroxyanthranilate isomerase